MQRAQLVEHVDRDLEGLGSNPNIYYMLHIIFSHPITFGALPTQVLLKSNLLLAPYFWYLLGLTIRIKMIVKGLILIRLFQLTG